MPRRRPRATAPSPTSLPDESGPVHLECAAAGKGHGGEDREVVTRNVTRADPLGHATSTSRTGVSLRDLAGARARMYSPALSSLSVLGGAFLAARRSIPAAKEELE